jgi:uncharacterized phosphosugar-binding protein
MALGLSFIDEVQRLILKVKESESESIAKAALFIADAIENDGLLHVFGCGHSQMYAEELFYRAGGLVPVNPILEPALSLRPEAPKSTAFERMEGLGKLIVANENMKEGDVLIIASTSGRNAVPVEVALEAQKRGVKVIGLTSLEFTNEVTSRHPSGKKLIDISDVVLDNGGVSGDAMMELEPLPYKFGPTSSIVGFTLLQAIVVQAIEELAKRGKEAPVWVSSNLDKGDAINKVHLANYKRRIKCL